MASGRGPLTNDRGEFVGCRIRVRGGDQFEQTLLSTRADGREIAAQHTFERLAVTPFRMPRRQRADAVQGEGHLCVDGLLRPQGPVVIEHRDAFARWHKVRTAGRTHARDELENRTPGYSVVPRR